MTTSHRFRTAFAGHGAVRGALWVVALASAAGCASAPMADSASAPGARYPRRGAGCELAVYYTAVPGVPVWDDLGIVEVTCHIDDAAAECLRRLRNEACRQGGDLIYNVPRQPLRPRDQVMLYRAQVAHTRAGAPSKTEDPDLPAAASAEEAAGPVIPLPSGEIASPASPPPTTTSSPQPPVEPAGASRETQGAGHAK